MNEYPHNLTALDVKEVLSKAAETKESAIKFLKDAGILDIKITGTPKSAVKKHK
jgi:hypothetical protein